MPIFYEITSRTGKKNYLFGTMHSPDEKINTLPLEIKSAFENASLLCVDSGPSQCDGKVLERILSEWEKKFGWQHEAWQKQTEEVERVTHRLAELFPTNTDIEQLVRTYSPLYVIFRLDVLHLQTKNSNPILDSNLIYMANKRSIPVLSLETPSSSLRALIGVKFTYEEQRLLLDILLRQSSQNSLTQENQMLTAYLEGNIDIKTHAQANIGLNKSEQSLIQCYLAGLLTERDKKMAVELEKPFLLGNTFVAVGATHLKGIVNIFQNKGYTIQEIPVTERIFPVLDYYERHNRDMQRTGVALIVGTLLGGVGLFISSQFFKAIILSIAALVLFYSLVKIMLFAYKYMIEPKLMSQPTKTIQPRFSPVSIFKASQENRPRWMDNHDLEEVLRDLEKHSPILFLDLEAQENTQKIIKYPGHHYQLKEAIHRMHQHSGSISQQDLDDVLQVQGDPREFARNYANQSRSEFSI